MKYTLLNISVAALFSGILNQNTIATTQYNAEVSNNRTG